MGGVNAWGGIAPGNVLEGGGKLSGNSMGGGGIEKAWGGLIKWAGTRKVRGEACGGAG